MKRQNSRMSSEASMKYSVHTETKNINDESDKAEHYNSSKRELSSI